MAMLEALLAALQGAFGQVGVSPLRERLMRMIEDRPGQHAMELCRNSGESWSTVQYHLSLLQKGEMVTSVEAGRTRRFFPPEMDERRVRLMAMLQDGRRLEVAQSILSEPGRRQVDICDEVGISRKTFRNAVGPLVEEGLLAERRGLRDNRYFPGEPLSELVHEAAELM